MFVSSQVRLLFSLLILAILGLAGTVQAQQPTPVTTIENQDAEVVLQSFVGGSFLAPVSSFSGEIPTEGNGARMMWYGAKSAFRAGFVTGSDWDEANIGGSSVAFGFDTEASGAQSVALNAATNATAPNATALGSATTASNSEAVAMGASTVASGNQAVAMGKDTEASGAQATSMGDKTVADGDYSFAAGRNAETGGNAGAFVWGDGSSNRVVADAENQVVLQAGGGMKVYSDSSLGSGVELAPGSGSWSSLSSRNVKTNVGAVNPKDVLQSVEALDVATWRYEAEEEDIRHMGPMAEDFYEAFGLGQSKKRIANVDADGVAIAAIQGLAAKVANQKARITDLKVKNQEFEERLAALEAEQSPITVAGLTGSTASLLLAFLAGGLLAAGLLWRRRS